MVDKIRPGFIRITVDKSVKEAFRPFEEDDETELLLNEKQRYGSVVGIQPKVLKIERDFKPEEKK